MDRPPDLEDCDPAREDAAPDRWERARKRRDCIPPGGAGNRFSMKEKSGVGNSDDRI